MLNVSATILIPGIISINLVATELRFPIIRLQVSEQKAKILFNGTLSLLIVYYTTSEVKSWPVQSTCKLTPEPKARVANMCSGVALFSPCCVYNFSSSPDRKYHIRVSEPGMKVILSAKVW